MKDIIETLQESGRFGTILSLLHKTELTETLKGAGPFTFFAPDDDAFQRVQLDSITADPDYLLSLLHYHIVPDKCPACEIAQKLELGTMSGKSLTIQLEEGEQEVDNARYVMTDIECSNGVIHIIDNVFLPQFSGWYD
ncbi:fasciclin domain-containing protein [Geomonas sp. RF6]|uniref:fasciclin domain-containing protein n=1 Tax=Geomonas sp. RF6 TaxID=2897342 RepID=UPI001E549285|nr:fasciclin domain-containing protein [Geomonas sp. RF6]UFS69544.1 fasciclin domain-containing protein [Geomonas sp. RF6]